MLSNVFGILLPDHDADLRRELQGGCFRPSSLPGQQQVRVREQRPVVSHVDTTFRVAPSYDTMGKHDKTVEQIGRLKGGLDWKKAEALLKHLEAEVYEGSESTVTFVIGERKLTVDRPHSRRECGKGLVKRLRSFLDAAGRL